jgi:ATPase subunit of ABC transporter with duplicated ATPase domains
VRKELAWLRRGPPARTSKPRFRIDAANALIADVPPVRDNVSLQRLATTRLGKQVYDLENVTLNAGPKPIFKDLTWQVGPGDRLAILGANGAGKTTLLRLLAGTEQPDAGEVLPGHGLRTGYFAQEHDTLDMSATVWENIRHASPDAPEQQLRTLLGSFMFSGDQLKQLAGTLSGGERTRLALAGLVSSSANVLLLDEPTNNLDPASREQVLDALRHFSGAVVLVTHDSGAVEALHPDKVIVLPDGTEDLWSADYLELVQLA